MVTKRHRKLEKKRCKEKMEKAKHRNRPTSAASLAYCGHKYRTDELVPTFVSAETGILEAFALSDGQLTDRSVEKALVQMILGMRRDTFPSLEENLPPVQDVYDEQEVVIWRIRSNWRERFQSGPDPGRDNLVGVLRTILGSIDVWSSADRTSRGYLSYIEDFLAKVGISVEAHSLEEEPDHSSLWRIGVEH